MNKATRQEYAKFIFYTFLKLAATWAIGFAIWKYDGVGIGHYIFFCVVFTFFFIRNLYRRIEDEIELRKGIQNHIERITEHP
ncbi:MAG: hypothetical protein CMF49_08415 [Legionellales bacterium]|nr:hypothetical protein [Legionellales bacterium]|tara:strand:- start:1152 stop:1397 length:246 start_codon:yes stop_codon:yes gene_type:complete